MKKIFTAACIGMAAVAAMPVFAGNIPQYKFSQTRISQLGADGETPEFQFKYLEDATPVQSDWYGDKIIFANGNQVNAPTTGPGFPIGFDFRFGGRTFTHFAMTSCGMIYLGDENGIVFGGATGVAFMNHYERKYNDNFYFGWHFPAVEDNTAIYQAEPIYIKTEGEAGSRTTTIEYRNMRLPRQSGTYVGFFDLHIVMHENGEIDMIFNERESPSEIYGFEVGLRGWDPIDGMLVGTGKLGRNAEVSQHRFAPIDNMTTADKNVVWNGSTNADDYDRYYLLKYTFTPDDNQTAPEAAPTNLTAEQDGSTLVVKCDRAAGSDATLIVVSEEPISEENYPEDGLSYGVLNYKSANDVTEYITKLGDATVVYYDNDENVEVSVPGTKQGKNYYIAAFAATGYPVYNTADVATTVFTTAQAAPKSLAAAGKDAETIELSWESEFPVIITASTTTHRYGTGRYSGVFDMPKADAQVGDKYDNCEVVYVGEGSSFEFKPELKNQLHYFQAWSVKDGVLSATAVDAHGVTAPSLPYEPKLENYPTYVVPDVFVTTSDDPHFISVMNRTEEGDIEYSLRVYNVTGETTSFYLPTLECSDPNGLKFEFDYAMETDRGFTQDELASIPLGNEPGKFEGGSIEVLSNNTSVHSVTEYKGTMESNGDSGYMSGTSTYDHVEAVVPQSSDNKYSLGLSFTTPRTSTFWLKNIKVLAGNSAVGEIAAAGEGVLAIALDGKIRFAASSNAEVTVYSIDGIVAAKATLAAGEQADVELPAGLYIVNGQKFIVK